MRLPALRRAQPASSQALTRARPAATPHACATGPQRWEPLHLANLPHPGPHPPPVADSLRPQRVARRQGLASHHGPDLLLLPLRLLPSAGGGAAVMGRRQGPGPARLSGRAALTSALERFRSRVGRHCFCCHSPVMPTFGACGGMFDVRTLDWLADEQSIPSGSQMVAGLCGEVETTPKGSRGLCKPREWPAAKANVEVTARRGTIAGLLTASPPAQASILKRVDRRHQPWGDAFGPNPQA